MNLHAIMIWYDESPTWLAGCVASLTRIGVDHLIAVDGRFPHFNVGSPTNSSIDQTDAIASTAAGADIALTLHRLREPVLEAHKRTLAFRLLNATADTGRDWALVIDADEMIVEGGPETRRELRGIDADTHVASARVASTVDPYAEPAPDNDVNERTESIHRGLPTPQTYVHLQSRFWRVLDDMRVDHTHYNYTGVDATGTRVNVRPDIGRQNLPGMPVSPIHMLQDAPVILHRKNQRTKHRQLLKKSYYETRDELGLELVT